MLRTLFCFALVMLTACAPAPTANSAKETEDAIRAQIAKYASAIDGADLSLASQVWQTSEDVSFIHPAGHAHGWNEVQEVYKFFGATFTDRKLTFRDIVVRSNGDTAWVEAYWNFRAKPAGTTQEIQSEGRESQVYTKSQDGWRMVHAHYSGPAMTPPGQ